VKRENLEFSSLSINEISWMVGYEDAGAFRRVFQKIMGLSPENIAAASELPRLSESRKANVDHHSWVQP
jgi:transcriptional regulator GlxA family with amidase domain